MNIRQHALRSIRGGMPARIEVKDGVPGVQFLADDHEFIEFDDLGYTVEFGYYRLSVFPDVQSDCTNENPETIHRYTSANEDGEEAMYVWMDGDGYPHMLGEAHQVADLYRALRAFLRHGELHPEPIDEFDPSWGNSYDIADAVKEAMDAEYTDNPVQMADSIRAACRAGRIRGVKQMNGRWYIPSRTFRDWLIRSQSDRRGRPRKNGE